MKDSMTNLTMAHMKGNIGDIGPSKEELKLRHTICKGLKHSDSTVLKEPLARYAQS